MARTLSEICWPGEGMMLWRDGAGPRATIRQTGDPPAVKLANGLELSFDSATVRTRLALAGSSALPGGRCPVHMNPTAEPVDRVMPRCGAAPTIDAVSAGDR